MNKQAGLATMGADGQATLHEQAVDYIRHKYNKPGRVFLGVVSRLDAMTSGVIVMPRTSKSASRLMPQFAPEVPASSKKAIQRASKIYLAAIEGMMDEPNGDLNDLVEKDEAAHRMRIISPGGSNGNAKDARLRYTVLSTGENTSVLAVRLLTGRKHQIRVQFADRGMPVLGDRKYGTHRKFGPGIALHSWRLRIEHPTKKDRMWFVANPPESWRTLLASVSLDQTLWQRVQDDLDIH